MTEILLTLQGWPPAKNEARSMFGEAHPHRPRVLALLRAAQDALRTTAWNPRETRLVGLEVVVVAPDTSPPSDATNYLGGVADVLQANRINADLSHLGEAASVSLYHDDAQVQEVWYSVEPGDEPGYRVRVWLL